MRDTPRTDECEESCRTNYELSRECGDPPYPGADMAEFARQLERELEAWKQYAAHAPTCPHPAKRCDCGLAKLMEGN